MGKLKSANLSSQGGTKAKLAIFKLAEKVERHPEAVAFMKIKQEIIEAHEETQKDFKVELKTPLLMTDPRIVELLDNPCGIEVEKISIPMTAIPESLSVFDMQGLAWLIDFAD